MYSWFQRLNQTGSHLKLTEIILVASNKENWEDSWAIKLEKWVETNRRLKGDNEYPEYHQ